MDGVLGYGRRWGTALGAYRRVGVITDLNARLLAVGAVGWAAMTAVIGLKAVLLDAKGKVRSKAGTGPAAGALDDFNPNLMLVRLLAMRVLTGG